jgi:hypothetical protein
MGVNHIQISIMYYIVWLITPVMGELTVLSFQTSSMHVELAKNPDK